MRNTTVTTMLLLIICFQTIGLSKSSTALQNNDHIDADLLNSPDFGVKIKFVGYSGASSDEIHPAHDNVYHAETDFITLAINLKIDVHGYTSWNLGNVTIPNVSAPVDFSNESITAGQLFLQFDNTLETLHENSLSELGSTVPLTVGDHTISVVYIGKGDSGIKYAIDTIIVRVREEGYEFEEYLTDVYNLDMEVTDSYEETNIEGLVVSNITTERGSRFTYYLEDILSPMLGVSFYLGNYNLGIDDSISILPEDLPSTNFTINGTIDAGGFSGLQLMGSWNGTNGISFLIDAEGLHPLFETHEIVLRRGVNFIGILSLAPYGIWHEKMPCLDGSTCEGSSYDVSDWQGKIINGSDSSFDFAGNLSGSLNHISIQSAIETTKTEDSEFLLNLSIISSIAIISSIVVILLRRRRK